ncbi:sulfite exporter TauE/SafE family protein [Heliomicrobium modesticaldum]|uniref:sulfite exporter TauE/SafE family protein n=1 Tax=Heliomicrobium modesticaldum TaxID=35701 RepID=UPI00059D122E|nr:sulfite exporter TauE/SafE family protein [Heliomicrobium modesticaldum]
MTILLFALGGFIAAAVSGAVGFGGALLLLPVLTHSVGATVAVPVLTIAQLIGNLSRVYFGYKEISWRPVGFFIMGAIPMSCLGAFSFVTVPKELITKAIGLAVIGFVILQHFKKIDIPNNARVMVIGGGIVGLLSGLVGSAGPLGAMLFFSLNLPPLSYIASEAVTAVMMHVTKIIIYQRYLDIGPAVIAIGFGIGISMIAGTWAGRKVIERLPKSVFKKVVSLLLVLAGLQLLFAR